MIGTLDAKQERKKRAYVANRAAILEKRKQNYAQNKEKILARNNIYYHQNKEAVQKVQKEWRASNPGASRKHALTRNYGITPEQWNKIFSDQDRCCAICRSPTPKSKKGWHTDHCHTSGAVRGILCTHCNVALGQVKDSVEILHAAIGYLETHAQKESSS